MSDSATTERPTFPLETLQNKPFPDGVDASQRELYLAPDVFESLFKTSVEAWLKMPKWKRSSMKKKHKLF